MKTVSFQGIQLSSGQRRRVVEQQKINAAMIKVIPQQISETLQLIEKRKEQGAKPDRIWLVERQEAGTTCIAEWMGF